MASNRWKTIQSELWLITMIALVAAGMWITWMLLAGAYLAFVAVPEYLDFRRFSKPERKDDEL